MLAVCILLLKILGETQFKGFVDRPNDDDGHDYGKDNLNHSLYALCERNTIQKDGEGSEEEQGDGDALDKAQHGQSRGLYALFVLHFHALKLLDALTQDCIRRKQYQQRSHEHEKGDHIVLLKGLDNVCDVCHTPTIL